MSHLTETAILNSFAKLISEKPFDKITVKEIVEDCGITRRTFYYHFQDLYGLMEALLRTEAEKALEEYEEKGSWEEAFIRAGRFFLENRTAVYHIYTSAHKEELYRYLEKITTEVMSRFVEEQARNLTVEERDKRLICDFYRSALTGLVLRWVENGMKEEPEPSIHRLGVLFSGNIRRALENSVREK